MVSPTDIRRSSRPSRLGWSASLIINGWHFVISSIELLMMSSSGPSISSFTNAFSVSSSGRVILVTRIPYSSGDGQVLETLDVHCKTNCPASIAIAFPIWLRSILSNAFALTFLSRISTALGSASIGMTFTSGLNFATAME